MNDPYVTPNPFKIGDVVVCIDDDEGYYKCIKLGTICTVNYLSSQYVNGHFHTRFRLATEPKSLDDYM